MKEEKQKVLLKSSLFKSKRHKLKPLNDSLEGGQGKINRRELTKFEKEIEKHEGWSIYLGRQIRSKDKLEEREI